MDKLEYCKMAHDHKDELMEKFMNGEPVTTEMMIKFLVVSEICSQNIMEMQRENVFDPLNAKLK